MRETLAKPAPDAVSYTHPDVYKRQDKSYNAIRKVATRRDPDYAQKHGLAAPVAVYPLYENATRAAWGQSLAEAQGESAEIWSRFSEVAAANEGAWIRKPATPADILRVDERNRPIAFPYSCLLYTSRCV